MTDKSNTQADSVREAIASAKFMMGLMPDPRSRATIQRLIDELESALAAQPTPEPVAQAEDMTVPAALEGYSQYLDVRCADEPVALQGRDDRADFEARYAKYHPEVYRDKGGTYGASEVLNIAWVAWQAARASLPAGGVVASQDVMAKARALFGWVSGLGGFEEAVTELLLYAQGSTEPFTAPQPSETQGRPWPEAWEAARLQARKAVEDHRGFEIDALMESQMVREILAAFESLWHEIQRSQQTQGRRQMTSEQRSKLIKAAWKTAEPRMSISFDEGLHEIVRATEAFHDIPPTPPGQDAISKGSGVTTGPSETDRDWMALQARKRVTGLLHRESYMQGIEDTVNFYNQKAK